MENKKYIVLKPTQINQNCGGIVIITTDENKTACYISLFGVENLNNEVLIDDLVSVRQFSMKHKMEEFEIDKTFSKISDFVVGIFDDNKRLILIGSTIGVESAEKRERLYIALENKQALNHFGKLARDTLQTNRVGKTFFEETILTLLDLFSFGVPDFSISGLIQNSKWVKVFSEKEIIGVGVVENNGNIESIGLAFPVMTKNQKKKEIDNNFKFFPLNASNPNGFGYYIVLQSAKDGSVVPFKAKTS